jgi:hypothetical protein
MASSASSESIHAPVVEIDLSEPALGAEFMRWEIATAVAGAVPESARSISQRRLRRDATNVLLTEYKRRTPARCNARQHARRHR